MNMEKTGTDTGLYIRLYTGCTLDVHWAVPWMVYNVPWVYTGHTLDCTPDVHRCALDYMPDCTWTVHQMCPWTAHEMYTVHVICTGLYTIHCTLEYTLDCTLYTGMYPGPYTILYTVCTLRCTLGCEETEAPAWCFLVHCGHTSFEHIYAKCQALIDFRI